MIIRVTNLRREFTVGVETIRALAGVDLSIERGEMVAIMGSSGSGKSTLMNILGCLDHPTSGTYELDGKFVSGMDEKELAGVRNEKIGFVFQSFELLPRTPALANVELPLLYAKQPGDRRDRAVRALERVGLADRMDHRPNQLSGGQKQRVAVARALLTDPALLLADEPTGNLDTKTTEEIMRLFADLHDEGRTVVIVTHEPEIAEWCTRVVRLRDGLIESDKSVEPRR